MSLSPTLIILAAGMGSRYGGLKQVDPIGPAGEAVLDYSVFDARRAGFGKVIFVIRTQMEAEFRAAIGCRFEGRINVVYAFQELADLPSDFHVPASRQKPWGTGHALLCAEREVRGPFAVINADDFYGAESFKVMGEFLTTNSGAAAEPTYAMVGYRLDSTLSPHGTVARGLCEMDAQGWLTGIEELTAIEKTASGARNKEPDGAYRRLTGQEIISLNLWGFTPAVFDQLKDLFVRFLGGGNTEKDEFYLSSSVNTLIQEGRARVKILPTAARWFGITYREDRAAVVENVRALVRSGAYPENLCRAPVSEPASSTDK
jgi:choline kinase